jgi:hypothetical protein
VQPRIQNRRLSLPRQSENGLRVRFTCPMKIRVSRSQLIAMIAGTVALVFLQSCGKSDQATGAAVPRNPQEAASQLQAVFAQAAPSVKQTADTASIAMRKGDYEKAVVALQVIRSGTNVTFEQGLAVHNSVVAMERQLVYAADAGDEKAKRAYRLLKDLKRN